MKLTRKFYSAIPVIIGAAVILLASYPLGAAVTSAKFVGDFKSPYTKGHASAGADIVESGQCVQCHRTTIPGNALKGGRSVHQVHLASLYVTFGRMTTSGVRNGCSVCHTDTNTSNYMTSTRVSSNLPISYEGDVSNIKPETGDGSTTDVSTKLRKHVSPRFCLRCHGKFRTSIGAHGGVIPVGCAKCHGAGKYKEIQHQNRCCDLAGTPNPAHLNIYFINIDLADGDQPDSRCMRCHGAHALYEATELNRGTADGATP